MKYLEPEIGLEVELIQDPETGKYVQFEWRDVVGYEGLYQVSNYGNMKRLSKGNWILMPVSSEEEYYPKACIRREGVEKYVGVHRLVCRAFNGSPPLEKPYVNHINGLKSDNRPSNLEWCSHSHNMKHAYYLGLNKNKGVNNHYAKLTESQVTTIYRLSKEGRDLYDLANEYGVCYDSIYNITVGKTWNHLTKEVYNPRSVTFKVINCKGEIYDSAAEAGRVYNIPRGGITASCKGRQKSAGKYPDGTRVKWKYYKEEL